MAFQGSQIAMAHEGAIWCHLHTRVKRSVGPVQPRHVTVKPRFFSAEHTGLRLLYRDVVFLVEANFTLSAWLLPQELQSAT
jgi:hypothetical protein